MFKILKLLYLNYLKDKIRKKHDIHITIDFYHNNGIFWKYDINEVNRHYDKSNYITSAQLRQQLQEKELSSYKEALQKSLIKTLELIKSKK